MQSFVSAKILLVTDAQAAVTTTSANRMDSPESSSSSSKEDTKTPAVANYTPATKFRLNLNFNNKRIKFKLIVAQQKESPLLVKHI